MENKLKVFGVTVLIVIFGLFLPSFLQFRDMDSFAGRITSNIRTETKYTDDMGVQILHDSYLRSENQKEAFSAQKFEQRKNVQRLSIEFFVILIFSLGICLKRVYLSYIQFYSFPFERFLWEQSVLLKKDGKKRGLAFAFKD